MPGLEMPGVVFVVISTIPKLCSGMTRYSRRLDWSAVLFDLTFVEMVGIVRFFKKAARTSSPASNSWLPSVNAVIFI